MLDMRFTKRLETNVLYRFQQPDQPGAQLHGEGFDFGIGGSLPLMIRGESVPITRALRTQGTHWVCGAIQLSRASQEALTR